MCNFKQQTSNKTRSITKYVLVMSSTITIFSMYEYTCISKINEYVQNLSHGSLILDYIIHYQMIPHGIQMHKVVPLSEYVVGSVS